MENTIQKLIKGNDLTYDETKKIFKSIVNGELTKKEALRFLSALNTKKATSEELKAEVDVITGNDTSNFKSRKKIHSTVIIGKNRTNSLNF